MQAIPLGPYSVYAFLKFYRNVKENKKRIKENILLFISLLSKKSINILLADDDLGSREIFIDAIAEIAPYARVRTAANGQKLMNVLLSETEPVPDIIFLDLNMPLKNGHECLQEIRNNERLRDIPVIIYSTSSNEDHIDDTYDGGANFYLIKPDSFNDLKLVARNVLSFDWVKPIWPERGKFVLIPNQFK
jgi:PleD family two-component response regulator